MTMKPKSSVPTKKEIFDTDFNYGYNVPQDFQDSQESQRHSRITGPSWTSKEKQRVFSQLKEKSFDPGSLALDEYLRTVYEWLQSETERLSEPERWCSPLFQFTRFAKAHPNLTHLRDYEAADKVERIMRDWNGFVTSDPWEFFFPEAKGGESARTDFMASWNAVRHIPFHDVLSNALRLAVEKPLPPQERGPLYWRFLSLAAWLQVLLPGKPISLPTRRIGELLGCDQRTVSRLRGFAVEDRLLIVLKPHSFRSNGRSEATEFRFALERYPHLVDGEPK